MRIVSIIGGIFLFIGIVWILQGLNILKGSFMTGQGMWGAIGVVAAIIGAGLIAWDIRTHRPE